MSAANRIGQLLTDYNYGLALALETHMSSYDYMISQPIILDAAASNRFREITSRPGTPLPEQPLSLDAFDGATKPVSIADVTTGGTYKNRFRIVYTAFALTVALSLVALGAFAFSSHATRTKTVHVERSWGAPTQSVPGDAVNENFAGLTCDVYQARKTVVCHP